MTSDPEDSPNAGRAPSRLARYLRPDLPPEKVKPAIREMLAGLGAMIDEDRLDKLVANVRAAIERSDVTDALEQLTAYVARRVLTRAALAERDPLPEPATAWISRNVTAASRFADRVTAIWRVEMGLAEGDDQTLRDIALKSALSAEQPADPAPEPAPEPAPAEPSEPGKEDKMLDPIALRDKLLARLTFNPSGLPAMLRSADGQKIYVDAVVQGVLRQQQFGDGDEEAALLWSGSVAGLLLVDGVFNPSDQRFYQQLQRAVVELAGSADETGKVQIDGHGLSMFAPDDDTQRIRIFGRTAEILFGLRGAKTLFLQSFARVARIMADRFADHRGDQTVMEVMATSAYANDVSDIAMGGGGGGNGGVASVELPPLNDPQGVNDEIEPDNVRAVSTIYVTYQLEFALKAGARVLDLFVAGLLPIPASDATARELDNLYWENDDLLDEASRRSVYSRVLGAPGGELAFDIQPNVEFNTGLMRVVSAVSEFEREQAALTHFDNAARGRRFQSTSGEFVRKAVRDFAANVSLRGWAGTAFTAERMARQVKKTMKVLSLPSVRNAFGVTTPWQVVERVSQREFGITVNTVLHRTLAVETQTIMGIIADNHGAWSNGSGLPLFPNGDFEGSDLTPDATRRLMVACQHFRAVTGVGDTLLDEYSSPVETPAMPSLPDNMSRMGLPGGGAPGIDMGGISQLRDMVASGRAPSLDQLRAMLPGF